MDRGFRPEGGGNITKFFITNLPEGCTPWELRCGVASYGEVSGTFVAKKRDKEGRRFGFASFKDVKDKTELEKSLKGIKLGGSKLIVNIARFSVENVAGGPPSVETVNRPYQARQVPVRQFNFKDSRSYSDVLGKGKVEGPIKETGSSVADNRGGGRKLVVVPDRTTAFRDLWGIAVVARTVDLETLVDLDQLLRIAKVGYSNIQYLGGLSILISFVNKDAAKIFYEAKDVWGPWFSKLDVWEGQSMPFERVAWLRLLGVPLHLLETDVVKLVGEEVGKVLYVRKSFGGEKDLSMGRIGVLVGEVERIKEFIMIRWKNRSFRILVEEEIDVWVPDCLGEVLGNSPTGSSPLASSPVGRPVDSGSPGGGVGEVEETCMGGGAAGNDDSSPSLSKNVGQGEGPNEVSINWQPFVNLGVGKESNEAGSMNEGIHFFKACGKTKRFRKGGPKSQNIPSAGSPVGYVDSSEKNRPKKRSRAQVVESSDLAHEDEDSDPFSLDKLLNQMRELRSYTEGGQSPASSVNLNRPLNSDGVPIDVDVGHGEEILPEGQSQRHQAAVDLGDQGSGGIPREDDSLINKE
ncbi:putative RNA recognition motif domain, nucleotide-binding alpha-beta plait domain superfamily [Helianthus debilis subsp. tardiflorus]